MSTATTPLSSSPPKKTGGVLLKEAAGMSTIVEGEEKKDSLPSSPVNAANSAAATDPSSPPAAVTATTTTTTKVDNNNDSSSSPNNAVGDESADAATFSMEKIQAMLLEKCGINNLVECKRVWELYRIPILVALVCMGGTSSGRCILQHFSYITMLFVLRMTAWACGIALGLGWAIHVYEQLDLWHNAHQQQQQGQQEPTARLHPSDSSQSLAGYKNRVRLNTSGGSSYNKKSAQRTISGTSSNNTTAGAAGGAGAGAAPTTAVPASGIARSVSLSLEDEHSYASLMQSAGYAIIAPKILRGQVLRQEDPFWKLQYIFTDSKSTVDSSDGSDDNDNRETSRALRIMQDFWPTLPTVINEQLALFMEHVLRDYVAAWYGKVDLGICYKDAAAARDRALQQQEHADMSIPPSPSPPSFRRRVLLSTARHRPAPFVDALYESMAIIFGNLATRVEHVNIMHVALLQWTRILAHTFKVYRHLRRQVRIKQIASSHSHHSHNQQGHAPQNTSSSQSQHDQSSPSVPSQPSSSSSVSSPPQSAPTTRTTSGSSAASSTNHTQQSSSSPAVAAAAAASMASTAASFASGGAFDSTAASVSSARERMPTQVESSFKVSEISMTKEFLFCNKLHKAITFGLDVPALLFADATGRECGVPTDSPGEDYCEDPQNAAQAASPSLTCNIEDAVLEARLFGAEGADSNILLECELDYNRVLAHRMVRALLPRGDFGSNIVSTFITEIMAGCILSPIMSCLGPDYINGWIIKGLSSREQKNGGGGGGGMASEQQDQPQREQQDANQNTAAATTTRTTAERRESDNHHSGSNSTEEAGSISNNKNEKDVLVRGWNKSSSLEDEDVLEKFSVERRLTSSSAMISSAESSLELSPSMDGDKKQQPSPETHKASSTSNNNATESPASSLLAGKQPPPAMQAIAENPSTASLPSSDDANGQSTAAQEQAQQEGEEPSSLSVVPPSDTPNEGNDEIMTQLAMALIDLQRFLDFEEFRDAREANRTFQVDWDDAGCRGAVLQLVLVIEAALTHGRCIYKPRSKEHFEDDDDGSKDGAMDDDGLDDVEVTLPEYESATLSQILMEMTSDIDAFEERVATENTIAAERRRERQDDEDESRLAEPYKPTATEQSTLRTLIAAWLHTGQIYRTVTVLVQAHATVLAPYYHSRAFLRSHANAAGFVRQLKALEGVDVLVDTMAVLASPRLEEIRNNDQISTLLQRSSKRPSVNTGATPAEGDSALLGNTLTTQQYMPSTATPRHFDFHRNEAFAASLRSERERRSMSWYSQFDDEFDDGGGGSGVPVVCHVKGGSEVDTMWHRELHHLARIFYSGTNLIAVRDAARRKDSREADENTGEVIQTVESSELSLLTVETACPRRRIEVPDDDSSFLLRAQPRPLNAMGVHRDQRNHDHSFKCFAATYEEPAIHRGSDHFAGGRFVRRCLVRYFPIDRTASVVLQNDVRKLDQRKSVASSVPDTITVRPTPFLSSEFLRERHLCQRWVPKGTMRTQSILASSVMEPTDFTSQPRAGKAIDFVYRLTFFEKPMILLGDKHFTVHDSSSMGSHRADGSSMEISDAGLSAALCIIGETEASSSRHSGTESRQVEMGEDGYPIIWMKFSRKQDSGTHVEVKPYRISFVRAALLVTAARHEAQLQSLVRCVRAGSAKSATKALTDARLKPTLRLLEYAGHRSREKQSLLLRDLKLGVNHIDREQLRRNGLLSPRYPTAIKELFVSVEDALQAEEVSDADLYGATGTVFKIKCAVLVELVADDEEMEYDTCYRNERGELSSIYREEWVVYRSFKEFQAIHKHLKNEVSTSESSGTTVSRLSASLNASGATQGRRQRNALIPSLSHASKLGALGITKKSLQKRKEYLDGYLAYLLGPTHLLNRSVELLLFVGAFYPLPSEVRVGLAPVSGIPDPLGRTQMSRTSIQRTVREVSAPADGGNVNTGSGTPRSRASSGEGLENEDVDDETESARRAKRKLEMIPSIRNKIDKVPLSLVRNRVFELLRYQFGFENASFVRNRMLATLKTASFAVTSASEFRRTLYNLHVEHLSADSLAGWIKFGLDMLWPDGVFFESAPPLTPEELVAQMEDSKTVLHETFPDALRTILGQDLTKDGVEIFHEMLQNRVVVKSMAYMLVDVLWLEMFPEIGDVLQGGAALDMDS